MRLQNTRTKTLYVKYQRKRGTEESGKRVKEASRFCERSVIKIAKENK